MAAKTQVGGKDKKSKIRNKVKEKWGKASTLEEHLKKNFDPYKELKESDNFFKRASSQKDVSWSEFAKEIEKFVDVLLYFAKNDMDEFEKIGKKIRSEKGKELWKDVKIMVEEEKKINAKE